ncbi:hypothetical protein B0H65DRAFT_565764 [Neurospora tetraspora]|uniref:Ecp2 effector protein domain-containing protein n=1 Tax=Neurospora tetraspora TaxID=94610 RepID=A0AAE0J076_9PEZI|nr:hypothetical protein B0H65DRAFT_565764 [Neurospora tetraspora]
MKHEALFSLLWTTLSAALTLAAPSHFGLKTGNIALAERTTTKLDARKAADDSNCVAWTDGHGDLKCNEFSIILGHPNLADIITKNYLFIYMLNVTNEFIYTSPTNPFVNATNILEIKSALNCNGDQWKSVPSVLPWTIDLHGGNACNENAYNGPYDNTWINYSGQHLNVPADGRCRWMKRVGFRCVVDREG